MMTKRELELRLERIITLDHEIELANQNLRNIKAGRQRMLSGLSGKLVQGEHYVTLGTCLARVNVNDEGNVTVTRCRAVIAPGDILLADETMPEPAAMPIPRNASEDL